MESLDMATVSTPVRSRNLAEAHQRVRSPLERLRRFIRAYVSLEGAAVVGLYSDACGSGSA